jgi:integrase
MPSKRKPGYLLHKPTGQARVRIDGRDHYLGPYGSPESRERYEDLIAEWFARHGDVVAYTLKVDELCLMFIDFADGYYRRRDGTPTGTVGNIRSALKYPVQLYGTTRVRDFGPRKLKAVRQAMIDDGRCRTNINRLIHWVRRVFRWGVENEHVPPDVYAALIAVPSLKAGRSEAVESEAVRPVDEATVNATLPHLPRIVAAMVELQLLTGARPGEITSMRPIDLTFGTDGVWTYRPATHKTQHRGKERRIYLGPKAQSILSPFLDRDPEAHCFSPAEAETERNAERRKNRESPMTPSQAARSAAKGQGRTVGQRYMKDSYGRAVGRACEAGGIPKWSPNQLRHSRATIIRERYGVEAAMVVLGHSDTGTTEIYAERNFELAARIMAEVG